MSVLLTSFLGGNAATALDAMGNAVEKGGISVLSGKSAAVSGESQGDFQSVIAANTPPQVTTEQLRKFFASRGIEVGAAGEAATANEMLARVMAAQDGQKLPGELVIALHEMLSPEAMTEAAVTDSVPMDFSTLDLPNRELTPEELSELVQETGFPPVVIFAALQDTSAASPNLAAALGEVVMELPAAMGSAAGQGAQAQTMNDAAAAEGEAVITQNIAAMMQKGLSREEATRIAQQMAMVDFAALQMDKVVVQQRIAAVLRGETLQGEFNWDSAELKTAATHTVKEAAQNAAVQTAPAAMTPSTVTQQGNHQPVGAEAPSLLQQSKGDVRERKAAHIEAQTVKLQAEQQLQHQGAVVNARNAAAQNVQVGGGEQNSANSQVNFATTLEQSTALRQVNAGEGMTAQLQRTPYPHGTPGEQVEVKLRHAVAEGTQRMEIQLKPAELGRVDVRIETHADGRSHVTVTADRRDTLDLLQRDVRALERALQEAGLKTEQDSLSFNLRGDEQQQAQQQQQEKSSPVRFNLDGHYDDELDSKLENSENALTYDAGRAYRLNLDWGVDISV